MIARGSSILALTPTTDHTGKEGYFVELSAGNAAICNAATDVPFGLILEGQPTTGKSSIGCSWGGLNGTVKVKLNATPGTVNRGTQLKLAADGTAVANDGAAGSVLVALALESGSANELIEAVLIRPVVVPASIDDGSVTAAKLAANAVVTAAILDANVTAAKLAATLDLSGKTLTLPGGQSINSKSVVVVDADGATLAAADSGKVYATVGASGAATFALPAAALGLQYKFYVGAAQELRIDPNGSETIAGTDNAQGAAGKYLTANAAGEWIEIICLVAGTWNVLGFAGTWTHES